MFNHVPVRLPQLTATNKDGIRLYETPEGDLYPSITTVLSIRKKEGLFEWRKKVGNEVANYVSGKAARRGTKVHQMCEDFLNNMNTNFPDKFNEHKKDFLPWCLFSQLREKYNIAGRVDCISQYKGVPSVIDFKTSTKERSDDWNENYYIQGTAYSEMFHERTGISISQVVILVVTEDGTVQEFIKNKYDYIDDLSESIKEWRVQNV